MAFVYLLQNFFNYINNLYSSIASWFFKRRSIVIDSFWVHRIAAWEFTTREFNGLSVQHALDSLTAILPLPPRRYLGTGTYRLSCNSFVPDYNLFNAQWAVLGKRFDRHGRNSSIDPTITCRGSNECEWWCRVAWPIILRNDNDITVIAPGSCKANEHCLFYLPYASKIDFERELCDYLDAHTRARARIVIRNSLIALAENVNSYVM